MKSIRRLAFGAALTLSALNSSPSLAQEAAGTFKLAHEVHWQNAVVPAGTYRFTTQSSGPEMLTLHKVDGDRSTYMMMVVDTEESHPSDQSQLVVVSRPTGQFVTTMRLPDFGMTLHFSAPPESRATAAGEEARAGTVATTTTSGIR